MMDWFIIRMSHYIGVLEEVLCWHQWFPFYHNNMKYGGHWCIHCGKWKNKEKSNE